MLGVLIYIILGSLPYNIKHLKATVVVWRNIYKTDVNSINIVDTRLVLAVYCQIVTAAAVPSHYYVPKTLPLRFVRFFKKNLLRHFSIVVVFCVL